MKDLFRRIANKISTWAGSAWTFLLALLVVIAWAVSGPLFDFSETWQLFINTGTTIVTFLMVFLIQNTQNRDGKAVQLKLDELIRASSASDSFVDLEDMTDDELEELEQEFKKLHERFKKTPLESMHKRITSVRDKRKNK